MSDFTNFHSYSHGDLRKMVQAMDSGGVMAASDPWRRATQTLKDIHTALNTASLDATSSWEGSTSQAFLSRMTKLANTVNNAAAYANDTAVSLQIMSEAIDTAKRDMPEEPSFWDQVGDGAKGFAESAVGIDNATTETSLADRRKAQAVGVMETLATNYRAATAYLKPPRGAVIDEQNEVVSDQSPAEAISALIMGGGMGFAGASQTSGGTGVPRNSSNASIRRTPQAPREDLQGPTDSGVKGGTANLPPRPQFPTAVGPGTGIDDVKLGLSTAGAGNGSLRFGEGDTAIGRSGDSSAQFGVTGGGRVIGSNAGATEDGSAVGRAGRTSLGRKAAFGTGGLEGGEAGTVGRSGLGGAARKGGGVVGEASGGTGKRAFTEGGSGIGRGRAGGQGATGQGHGMLAGSHAGKSDKKQAKGRPDYLVEDEETWVSGQEVNPEVIE